MTTQLSEQIDLLKGALIKRFDAKQIIIFGSHAYGNADKESDIDLCVITDLQNKRKIDIIREIRRELINVISSPLDILVYNEEEFRRRAVLSNTLEHKIMSNGIMLYG